jgi:hypothetical protein
LQLPFWSAPGSNTWGFLLTQNGIDSILMILRKWFLSKAYKEDIMNVTDRLRFELMIREQLKQHGDEFYTELEKILQKILAEQAAEDGRGKPNLVVMQKGKIAC